MKRKRTIIVLITLVSYFFFILVVTLIGVHDERSIRGSKIIDKRRNKIYSNIESINSVSLNRKLNCGLDPTPIPPLPPNIEDEIEAEMTD